MRSQNITIQGRRAGETEWGTINKLGAENDGLMTDAEVHAVAVRKMHQWTENVRDDMEYRIHVEKGWRH